VMRGLRRDRDLLTVVLFLLGGLVERLLAPESEGSVLANLAGALVMSVPLYWLRTHPVPVVVTMLGGSVVNQLIATDTTELFSAIVLLIVLGFRPARDHDGRGRWVPLGVLLLGAGMAEVTVGSGSPEFVWTVVGGGAVGGAVLRSRADLTRRLAERTHELQALRELRERDAALDERRRIARELHDVVAHTVSVMVVQAGGARRQVARDPGRAVAALDQVQATGEETLVELQRLFGLLHGDAAAVPPRGLDDVPAVVERTRAAGLPVDLVVEGDARPLDPEADLAAFRLIQEALTNTLKHAGPATARVTVRWSGEELELVVSDTGWGADGPRGDGSRRGLAGMRERIEPFGGDVQAGPRAAGGFEVRARLPLARQEVPA
jgi:signal transduction histidine kinase